MTQTLKLHQIYSRRHAFQCGSGWRNIVSSRIWRNLKILSTIYFIIYFYCTITEYGCACLVCSVRQGLQLWGWKNPWQARGSGTTELIPFLIWQYYPKWFRKAGGEKVKVVRFGWFNLYHMRNFEENQNINIPGPDSSCVSCNTQNGVGIPG